MKTDAGEGAVRSHVEVPVMCCFIDSKTGVYPVHDDSLVDIRVRRAVSRP